MINFLYPFFSSVILSPLSPGKATASSVYILHQFTLLKRFVADTAVFPLQVDFRLAAPAGSVLLDLLVHCHHRPDRTGVFSMR